MLGDLFKRILDAKAGRIHWYSNMWAITGSQWDKKRCVNTNIIGHPMVDENGVFKPKEDGSVLVKRKCVTNCPSPPGDDFFHKDGRYWVPATECKKCEHYRGSSRSFRFPRCTFQKPIDRGGVAKEALNTFSDALSESVKAANKMLGQ